MAAQIFTLNLITDNSLLSITHLQIGVARNHPAYRHRLSLSTCTRSYVFSRGAVRSSRMCFQVRSAKAWNGAF